MINPSASLPLAKAVLVKKLPGLRRKSFDVPAGRKGILVQPNGQYRILSHGRHVVSKLLPRLFRNENAEWVGYFPEEPFALLNDIPNLLSQDDELLDGSILYMVNVKDPLQFFQGTVIPAGEIPADGFRLPLPLVDENIKQLGRKYEAQDLSAGLPTEFILNEVTEVLEHELAVKGLGLVSIRVLSFISAEDRVKIAIKLQDLNERLDDLKIDPQFALAANQTALDELMRSKHEEMGIPAGVRPVYEPAQPQPAPKTVGNPFAGLKAWLQQRPAEKSPIQAGRILGMLGFGKPGGSNGSGDRPPSDNLDLEKLVRGSKQRIDQLVRSQTDQELKAIAEMLMDSRHKTYTNGDEPTALQIMGMQTGLKELRGKVQDPSFGHPPYLDNLDVPSRVLGQMLAYDEGLLVQIANHSEYAHIIQQKITTGEPVDEQLNTLASRMTTFEHAFARRSRIVKLK